MIKGLVWAYGQGHRSGNRGGTDKMIYLKGIEQFGQYDVLARQSWFG